MVINLALALAVMLGTPAYAAPDTANTPPLQTSLTMHSDAALAADFTHYPYVNPDAPKGGTMRQAALGTFDTLNPFTLKGKAPQALGPGPSLVYDRLTDRSWDEPFTLYPLIARGWRVAPDRSWITFYIDPRARFHDHSPITAADVQFSLETLRDYGRPNMRRVYKLVDRVKVIDPHTITLYLGPGFDRETVMILAMMPILSHAHGAGVDFERATLEPGLGSGPYRVASVDPGRRVVFERVPDYWAADLPIRRGQYNFDQIIYDYFRDDTVAFQSFLAGNLDFRRENDAKQWATGYDHPRVRAGQIIQATIPHGRAETVRGFIPNTRRPPFDNPDVRAALGLAFDFDWVNKNLYAGSLRRTTSVFPNTDLAATPEAAPEPPLRTRLQQADALLKKAGWVVRDGVRVSDKTGAPLRFEILLGSSGDEKIALAYGRTLKRLGIAARPRTLDIAAFRDRLNNFDYDMLFYFWQSTLSPGGEQALYWSCEAATQPGRFNYAGLCDPSIDALVGQIAQTRSRPDLIQLTHELDRAVMAANIIVPFGYNPSDWVATSLAINRPSTTPLYGVVTESWWAAKP
jgi:ABC-type oligopeptide transport system substrate-binding subunit